MAIRLKKFSNLAVISLLIFSELAFAGLAEDVEKQVLNDKSTRGSWVALKSIGWKMQAENRRGSLVEIHESELSISLNQQEESAAEFKNKIPFTKIAKLKASFDAYRTKLASHARDIALQFTRSFRWPHPSVDALGTGFNNYFRRKDITLRDLEDKNLVEGGEYANIRQVLETPEQRAHYASWVKKDGVSSSKAIESLMRTHHTSGCQIALNSIMWALVNSTYDDKDVFDNAFDEVVLNNALFRETKLFGKMSYDYSGIQKAKNGPNYLIGEAGYLTALYGDDKIDNPDYAGENFIITDMSPQAVEDFIRIGGFGYSKKSQQAGLSKLMVDFWKHGDRVLNRPVFSETLIWGHPGGELTLGDWLRHLKELNPRTPYGGFIYEYRLYDKQWQNYFTAHGQN
jgi:hypothetical protein